MQIKHENLNNKSRFRGEGWLSVFFTLAEESDPFLSWIAAARTSENDVIGENNDANAEIKVDLSKLLPKTSMMRKTISGYIGTETIPECKMSTGWYIISEPYDISAADLKFFTDMYADEKGNRRRAHEALPNTPVYTFHPLIK